MLYRKVDAEGDIGDDDAKVVLDLENAEASVITSFSNIPNLKSLLVFEPMKQLSRKVSWHAIFDPVNGFLSVSDLELQIAYAKIILSMRYIITANLQEDTTALPSSDTLNGTTKRLSELVIAFADQTHVTDKLVNYTATLPLQINPKAGERPQDNVKKTFFRKDYEQLLALAILCKMLAPIFNLFFEVCKNRIDPEVVDFHCASIIRPMICKYWSDLENKIFELISDSITRIMENSSCKVLSNVNGGVTAVTTIQSVYSRILSKRFVVLDTSSGSIVTYLSSTAAYHADSITKANTKNKSVKEFLPPSDSGDGDAGNKSNLEVQSRPTIMTADTPIIVKAAMKDLDRFIVNYELDADAIKASSAFYMDNPVPFNDINTYLITNVLGSYLCGARTVEYLSASDLAEIVPILQCYLIKSGLFDLAHLVSSQIGGAKNQQSLAEHRLLVGWDGAPMYSKCAKIFNCSVGDISWNTQLFNIVVDITQNKYVYNTAPYIWQMMGSEIANGYVIETKETIIEDICSVLYSIYQ